MLNVAPPETMRLIQAAFPQAINVGGHFGMTEASGAITCNSFDATPDQQAETHGAPLPDTAVRVVDPDTGEVLGPGCPGKLPVKGRGLMIGYYRDPELTAERMTEDGWLHSGDLGVIDGAGLVTYQARLKDMLKVGGENVSPRRDRVAPVDPLCREARPGGRRTRRSTRRGRRRVHRGRSRPPADGGRGARPLQRGDCELQGAPRYVRFVEDWPMSATKIQKFRLREQIAAELEGHAP